MENTAKRNVYGPVPVAGRKKGAIKRPSQRLRKFELNAY